MRTFFKKYGLWAVLSLVAVVFYVFNCFTPLAYDDYSYMYSFADGDRIDAFSDILESLQAHYFVQNGRIVNHFFAHLFLWLGKGWFNIINTLAFVLLGTLVYWHSFGSYKNIRLDGFMAIFIVLFLLTPNFGESFLWVSGASNYLYSAVLALAYLCFIRLCQMRDINMPVAATVSLVGGVVVGNTHEYVGVALLAMLFVDMICTWVKSGRMHYFMFFALVGIIIGMMTLLLAPGQTKRLDGAGGLDIVVILKNLYHITFKISAYFHLPIIVLVILCTYMIGHVKGGMKEVGRLLLEFAVENKNAIMFVVGFLISSYTLIAVPTIPDRVWSLPLVFITIAVLSLYSRLQFRSCSFVNSIVGISFILMLFSIGAYLPNMVHCHRAWEKRNSYVTAEKEAGKDCVVLDMLPTPEKYSPFSFSGECLDSNPEFWLNRMMAKYYGVNEIRCK